MVSEQAPAAEVEKSEAAAPEETEEAAPKQAAEDEAPVVEDVKEDEDDDDEDDDDDDDEDADEGAIVFRYLLLEINCPLHADFVSNVWSHLSSSGTTASQHATA